MSLWSIHWRTFAQLFSPYVLAAILAAQVADYNVTAEQLIVGASVALVGGLIAVGAAIKWGSATSPLMKALRSVAEKLLAGLGGVVITQITDIIALPRVLWPVVIGAVGAGVLTYFQNQGTPTPPATA